MPAVPVLLDGVAVKLGGREFVIPPLSLGSLKKLGPKIEKLQELNGVPTEAQCNDMAEVIHAAMKRNYPDLGLDQVFEMVDLGNFLTVFNAVLAVSGFVKKGDAAGEAQGPTSA